MDDGLISSVDALLGAAQAAARTPETAAQVSAIGQRLHGPLLVAIAGKVKAGKSTLLNALVGEALAAVDAGECTKIVTWYHRHQQPQVVLTPLTGPPRPVPFQRAGGELEIDLDGVDAAEVDHLAVGWPTPRLAQLTLVDTPGIASISVDVSARTQRILTPTDDRPPAVDAIIYLLRHTHATDAHFLESFHDDELAHSSPMNVVGVLSRADEIGSCRLDSLDVAERIAERYQADHRLRRLCPVVVPVAGLLGYAGATLRESEFRALAEIAALPADERNALQLTADRFCNRPAAVAGTELERTHLIDRLGLFGVRLAISSIAAGTTPDAASLAVTLAQHSGLDRLRDVLSRQFLHRSQILKARSALAAVQQIVAADGCTGGPSLQSRIEQLLAGTHAFEELRLLMSTRTEDIGLDDGRRTELDTILGGSGHDPASRLGLDEDATPDDIRNAALEILQRWQRIASHPLSNRALQIAARGACRTLEGLYADATGTTIR